MGCGHTMINPLSVWILTLSSSATHSPQFSATTTPSIVKSVTFAPVYLFVLAISNFSRRAYSFFASLRVFSNIVLTPRSFAFAVTSFTTTALRNPSSIAMISSYISCSWKISLVKSFTFSIYIYIRDLLRIILKLHFVIADQYRLHVLNFAPFI